MILSRMFCSPLRIWSFSLLASFSLSLLSGCGAHSFARQPEAATPENSLQLQGLVRGGQQPVSGATVQLYTVGTSGDMSSATPLIKAPLLPPVTDLSGSWSITGLYTCPSVTSEVYLIASGGNPGLAPGTNNTSSVLMSALGPCGNLSSATFVMIDEVSTIASIYPLAPFMSSYRNVGSGTSDASTLAGDFTEVNEFVNTSSGQSPGPALPAGFTAPVANLNSLANSMSACVNSTGSTASGMPCGNLFLYATPPGGTAPTNTADAILDIANNPAQNVGNIFLLSTASPAFQPVLSAAPADWTLKILPNITLTPPSNLVGVGSTITGSITLGQGAPSGGLVVNLVSSNTADVTVVNPVNIAAGASSASFSYTGVASGTATITASAAGYYGGSTTLSATSALIALGAVPTVAPGQAASLPLSLGTPAPAGGLTISFTSTNTAVATVTPSVFVAAGLQAPAANPQVTGVTVGTAQINATATGYAPGSRNVSVSVTASLPSTFSVPLTTPTNETLNLSAPASSGGITFTLTVDNSAIFSVPSSVTVPAGSTSVSIPITGLVSGTTNLRADSPNIVEAVSAVSVNGTIALPASAITTGKQLQVITYFYFAAAPPAGVTATITSSNPLVAVASTSPTIQGGVTASFPGITGTAANPVYVQGVGTGSTVLTVSAPGYTSAAINVTVDPSGFVIDSPGSISTTTLSPDTSVTILPAILNPADSTVLGYGSVTPATGSVSVPFTSGTTSTGTITNSPLLFGTNSFSLNANFHPVGAGSSTLSLGVPTGFSTPSPVSSGPGLFGPGLIGLGDSICFYTAATTHALAYLSLLGTQLGGTTNNACIGGTGIADEPMEMYLAGTAGYNGTTIAPATPGNNPLTLEEGGKNDSLGYSANAGYYVNSQLALQTVISHRGNSNVVPVNNCIRSGTWTADSVIPQALASSTNGSSLTCTVTAYGSNGAIGIPLRVIQSNGGTASVSIDGVAQSGITSAPVNGATLSTTEGSSIFTYMYPVSASAAGTSYTVVITVTSATGSSNLISIPDLVGNPNPAGSFASPAVGVMEVVPLLNGAGIVDTTAANVAKQATVATMQAYGYNALWLPITTVPCTYGLGGCVTGFNNAGDIDNQGAVTVQSWSCTSATPSICTFQSSGNNFNPGSRVQLSGFGTTTVFNGLTAVVLSAGFTVNASFSLALPVASGSATESGTATGVDSDGTVCAGTAHDQIHPNNCGHKHIFQALQADLNLGLATGTQQISATVTAPLGLKSTTPAVKSAPMPLSH